MRVSCNANYEVSVEGRCIFESALGRNPYGSFLCLVEVSAMLDELGADCAHRRVFLSRVAVRHYDRHSNAGVCSGESQRLAVVTARGGHDPSHLRPRALESVKIDNAATQLEGTYRRVVLVLYDDFHTGQRLEQRPSILWRRRNDRANQRNHVVKLSECKHLDSSQPSVISGPVRNFGNSLMRPFLCKPLAANVSWLSEIQFLKQRRSSAPQ